MYNNIFKKITTFLIIAETVGILSAQTSIKLGDNQEKINNSAQLEIESTTKGYLVPRMSQVQRDAIISPAVGLFVWCTDCNSTTNPPTGELSVFSGMGWPSFSLNTFPIITTGIKGADNAPVMLSASSATINGILGNTWGVAPNEIGILWKEITGNDFGTLPLLDSGGTATVPIYKTIGPLVTTAGSALSVAIPALASTTGFTRPYYFRAYAISSLGIGYGNTVILSFAPPIISTPVVTNGSSFTPAITGLLAVNAGTPQGTITEYGYCSSTTNPPTIANNKVALSTAASLVNFNAILNSDTFAADPTIDLTTIYNAVALGGTYFSYYVIAKGNIIYSPVVFFNPTVDLVTGGTAIATVSGIDVISVPPKIGVASSSTITVHLNVTKAGTYDSFIPNSPTGNTTGLILSIIQGGNFSLGDQTLVFSVIGTPQSSLDGNSFVIPRLGTLSTGTIQPADVNNSNAICDGTAVTMVNPVTSKTGKIWMDRNLGASRAATAQDDYMAYGCLFQWGRGNDGHASMVWQTSISGTAVNAVTSALAGSDTPGNALFIMSSTASFDWRSVSNNTLWQGISGINNPCPVNYRLPTKTEIDQEFDVTGYNITNSGSAFASIHKWVLAGNRFNSDGSLGNAGAVGYLWTSTITGSDVSYRTYDSSSTDSDIAGRALGFSVRCIKN